MNSRVDVRTGNLVASIAATWLPDVEALTGRLLAAVFADIPESADYEPVTYDDLEDGCRRYLTRVLALLCDDDAERANDDDVAWSIGRRRAEQGVPLEASLRTFRLGGRVLWEALLERAAVESIDPRELGAAATAMWTVVDGQSSALSTSYRRAQLEQQRRDDQHRRTLIEEILAGRATAGGYGRQIADQLEIPVQGDYLIVVAELAPNGTPALRTPQTVLAALGVRSIWHVRTDRLVGIVPLDGHDPQFVFGHLRPLARGRATSTSTSHGLAGIPLAHRLASVALRTLSTDTVGLVPVEERYPESLLLSSPELGRRLVNSWLGPVLALPAHERKLLLETLTAWLEADQSASVAADRLFCHRNTVLNRLRRVSELIGRDLSGRRAHVELSLALTAVELLATSHMILLTSKWSGEDVLSRGTTGAIIRIRCLNPLSAAAQAVALPHGYTLSITGTFAVNAGCYGFPEPLSTWLFVVGASAGFLVAVIISSGSPPKVDEHAGAGATHLFALVPSLVVPASVALGSTVSFEPLRLLVGGAAATILYILLVAAVVEIGRKRREMQQ